MQWRVRRVQPDEADRLRDIRLRALRDAPGAFASTFEAESGRPRADWEARATAWSAGGDAASFVAEAGHGEDLVGLVGGFRVPERSGLVELVSMWVAPEWRRRGVAQSLIEEVVAWARATGAEAVSLWVAGGNDAAMAAYRDAGFVLTGERQPLPSDPSQDELRMQVRLEEGGAG